MNQDKLEIYIHIPFCVKKCDYCDFLSMCADESMKNEYVRALVREIELSKEKMKDYLIDTVFIGGGTPSILDGKLIEKIMKTLRENSTISEDAEITIECNPGTVTKEKLESYKKAGINRISFGLQSANDEELKNIGRIHSYEQFEESFRLARMAGFDNINIDIMSALPGQSLESYGQTLDKVLVLEPEHISAYSLIVEEGTPLNDRVNEALEEGINILPDEDTEREMYYLTDKKLRDAGFHRYEISNYAKENYECRHNIGYWKRVPYLGFGLGAASLYQETRNYNTDQMEQYLSMQNQRKVQELEEKDRMEEFMFLGLRMMEGVSMKVFQENFHKTYDSVYGEVTEKLTAQGLVKIVGMNVCLTKRGVDISNYVMSEFLL